MLVLSRKTFERIHIGEDIIVTLSKVKGDRAILGIEAPADVKVLRGEIYDKILRGELVPDAQTQRDACDEGSGK